MTDEFKEIVARLSRAESLVCLTHERADGDALGCMAALVSAAVASGRSAGAVVHELSPRRYDFLFTRNPGGSSGPPVVDAAGFEGIAAPADLVVLVDTCSRSQLGAFAEPLHALRDKTVVIDHHATTDDIGSARWVDSSAAAAGVMVLELIEALGWAVDKLTAQALATAILTDTGWLRFANTDGRTLRAMARLMDAGLAVDELYERIYQSDRPQRLRLMQRVLGSLELHCDGRLAVMSLTKADFQQTGAALGETENLVNEALRLAGLELAVLLVENPEEVRISLRSRKLVNVAKLAGQFGGGGHARAAGLRTPETIDAAKQKLITACTEELEKT